MSDLAGGAAQWLPAARAGSREALGKVLEAARQYLLAIARQEFDPDLRAKNSPSDVVQETFVEAQRDFGQFQGDTEAELLAWLRQLLLNNLGQFSRRYRDTDKRQVSKEISLDGAPSSAEVKENLLADTPTPSSPAVEQEEAEKVRRTLERLPEHYRQVLLWRYEDDLPFDEIALRLGKSANAVRHLWARAVARFEEELGGSP